MKLSRLLEIALDNRKQVLDLQTELVDLDQGFGCELHPTDSNHINITITREGTDFTANLKDVWSHSPVWLANCNGRI